jgi:3-deoxy-D-manno-octulosonic-acid transferase
MEKVSENINSDILDNSLFNGKRVLVIGSSWIQEEELIVKCFNQFKDKLFLIIVPHEPNKDHITKTKELFPNSILLSEYDKSINYNTEVLIVDSIGKLLALYSFADAAIVGGGFGKSVHSLSEPAGYSIPLACGPNIKRSPEADELNAQGALTIIKDLNDCIIFINSILDKNKAQNMGLISGKFIKDKIGSSSIITNKILALAEGKRKN